jgi:HK97 gp10 family phage protein
MIDGIDKLIKDFEQTEKELKKELGKIAATAAKPTLQKAKEHAPVKTGALKSGLKSKAERSSTEYKRVQSIGLGKGTAYGIPQEYGFKSRKMEGKYYMKRAIEETQTDTAKTLGDAALEIFDRVMK